MTLPTQTKLTTAASIILAAIIVIAPLHAFATVYIASLAGGYDMLRLWPEVLLILISPVVAWQIWTNRSVRQRLQSGWLLWAVLCYVLLHIGLGAVASYKGEVNSYALLQAWIINLRLMVIFVSAWVLAMAWPGLHKYWKWLLLAPATLVVSFGLLQALALPYDFLQHFGYGPSTIAAYETVDEKLDYIRIQSTLRGANPLGAYLVLVMAALMVLAQRTRSKRNWLLLAAFAAAGLVLFYTYSRSAYIGLMITTLSAVILAVRSGRERRWLAAGLLAVALVAAGLFATFRTNDQLENTLFHTNEDSRSAVSSNEQRAGALQSGINDVVREPFGRGPGSAGPASIHNSQPARIAENYYLQIGQETGWLGLGLFIAIVVMVAKRLWKQRSHPLARALLISLAGISFINLLQHAWTDDTLALVWWGLAGIALALDVSVKASTKRK